MEDEVARIEIDSFDKLSVVDFSIVGKTLVAIDIRNISNMEDKRSCLLYTSPSPRDGSISRMPSSA